MLSDEDITAIVEEIDRQHLSCRYGDIPVQDMKEAVRFFKNFNETIESSKSVMWKTFIVIFSTGFITFLGWAIIAKIRDWGMK
jgi:uncharacterized membrane protein YecN with MAPEG domain